MSLVNILVAGLLGSQSVGKSKGMQCGTNSHANCNPISNGGWHYTLQLDKKNSLDKHRIRWKIYCQTLAKILVVRVFTYLVILSSWKPQEDKDFSSFTCNKKSIHIALNKVRGYLPLVIKSYSLKWVIVINGCIKVLLRSSFLNTLWWLIFDWQAQMNPQVRSNCR